MSLVLNGNLFGRFGSHLPTPIIEKVEVETDRIKATLSLYFRLEGNDPDGTQQQQIENDLQHLNIYATTVYGDAYADNIIGKQSNIFGELYSSNSSFTASYLKIGAETGMYVSGSDMFVTAEGQNLMVNVANWDFNYDGVFDEADMDLRRYYMTVTGNVETNTSDPAFGYSKDWVELTEHAYIVESQPIPDSMDPTNVALPIHKNGYDWAVEKMSTLLTEYSGTLASLQLDTEDYINTVGSVISDHGSNFSQVAFDVSGSSVQRGDDPIYDSSGNLILKYQVKGEITPNFNGDNRDAFSIFDSSVNIFNSANESLSSNFNKSLTLFAFSSFIDYNSILNGSTESYGISFSDSDYTIDMNRKFVNPKPVLHPEIFNYQTSDISYRKLFTNGELHLGEESVFMYTDSMQLGENNDEPEVYDNIPLRTITGEYYDDTGLSSENLYNSILALVGSPVQDLYSNTQSIEARNSLLLIASEYQYSTDLLKNLDEFRRSFPNKTSNLYGAIKNLVLSSNRLLKTGRPITKKLLINNIIVDKRNDLSDIVQYTSAFTGSIHPIYAQSAYISSEVRLEYSTDEGMYPLITSGYWFFDQEMALRYNSNICQLVDVSRIENVFGKEITNLNFYVTDSTVHKYVTDSLEDREVVSSDFDVKAMLVTYKNLYPHGVADQLATFSTGSIMFLDNEGNTGVPQYGSTDKMPISFPTGYATEYCYIIPRAWDLYINTIFTGSERTISFEYDDLEGTKTAYGPRSDYRMQCFEFQEISSIHVDDLNPNTKYLYSFQVDVQDNSLEVINALSSSYHSIMMAFEEYVGYASEHCSYNNLEGKFNDFFRDSIRNIYGDQPTSELPWVLAATAYHAHADVLLGVYDASRDMIAMRAKQTTELIGPNNGTLDNLVSFYDTMSSFYEDNYGSNSAIALAMESMENVTRTYPDEPIDAHFAPLPNPAATYDILLEQIDPSWTQRWEILMQYMVEAQSRLSNVITNAMNQSETILVHMASRASGTPGVYIEIPAYAYNSSWSNINVWLEGGYRFEVGDMKDSVGNITVGTGPADNPTNDYWVAATELAIVLDSMRKFSIFTLGPDYDDANSTWSSGNLELFKSINEEFLAPYLEEAAEVYKENKSSRQWKFSTMGFDDDELQKVYDSGAFYINMPFTWTTSWPAARVSNEYEYTQPAETTYRTAGDTLPVSVNINQIAYTNYNLTEEWISVNEWENETFSVWFTRWAGMSSFS